MYPSKGSNPYGQQQFGGGQQQYGQITGSAYGGAESGSRHALAARQASLMGAGASVNANSEAEMNQVRASQSSQGAQYGGPYAAVYGSSALSTRPQVGGLSSKGSGSSTFQGRASYAAALAESSKYAAGAFGTSLAVTADDFTSSGRGFTQKADQLSALKNPDYASIERRNYESQGSYIGRELQTDSTRRYVDPGSLSHQHQPEIHDQIDQASLLRQQHILKAQPLQSGDLRHADYYSARDAPILQGSQEISALGGRLDADSRALSLLGSTPYGGGQHAASILGVPPRRNIEDLMYPQGSSTTAYGVSLPPGRDYSVGKVLRSSLLDSDYQGSVLSRAHPSLGASIVDDRKDDIIAYRREIERDEELRRDLIREREKERDREDRDRARDRERERERDRERERERERLRERRDKERERDRKRERTPPRASRDRRGTSVVREEKSSHRISPRRPSPRRVSPRRDSVHRHRSPVKEKKREYVCKVSPFSLVDNERDHLSLSKRYPRLAISPEFSKVLLNWPNETINLSLHTPVSFEHDFLEVDDKNEKKCSLSPDESCDDRGKTVWNAKVILMSGISSDMLNEISSEKSNDDRLLHFNNILRFAILKKDRSFMAIGGPSDVKFDCEDHSVVYPSLVETAIRYVKDITQLDLQKCANWNPLLEIHYHRVGKDGLFSHKEITVLFVPNLSECLPSLDQWRSQWHAYKKSVADREKQLALSHDKKSVQKGEGAQGEKTKGKNVKDGSTSKSKTGDKMVKDTKKSEPKHDHVKNDESKSKKKLAEEKSSEPDSGAKPTMQKTEAVVDAETKGVKDIASISPKEGSVKKKIIKKVVKGKTAVKKESFVSSKEPVSIAGQKLENKDEVDKGTNVASAANEDSPSVEQTNAKASVRKKIVRKVAVGGAKAKEDNAEKSSEAQIVKKPDIKLEASNDKEDVKKEHNGGSTAQDTTVKGTGKKKIIRKVIKRKVAVKKEVDASGNFETSLGENIKGQTVKTETDVHNVAAPEHQVIEEGRSTVDNDKEKPNEQKMKDGKEEGDRKVHSSAANESKTEKGSSKNGSEDAKKKSYKSDGKDGKDGTKDEKEKKNNKDTKHDSAQKPLKESKGKGSSEEPPNHSGLILKTKRHPGSKLRSTSLSLFGLLDYNDNDVEESTFELSLFAESLNEMLQYQMGCRLLSFLEKLYVRYIKKRNERKRQREENARKETKKDTEKSTAKRLKVEDDKKVAKETIDPEKEDKPEKKNDGNMDVDGAAAGQDKSPVDNEKADEDNEDEEDEGDEEVEEVEEEVEEEEDPEEIIEEEVDDMEEDKGNDSNNIIGQGEGTEKFAEAKAGVEDKNDPSVGGKDKASNVSTKVDNEDKSEKKNSKSDSVVDKDLLLAFRFFDRNRMGFIKVEDLKCILHNLGKFLSHKEVKEMVQSAISESNSVSDRISYMKLVKLTDL